jgi:hypothetical protein
MAAPLPPLPPEIAVLAYPDPAVEARGYRPDHPVVTWAWAPIVGPSATLLYLHLATIAAAAPGPVTVDTADLLAGIGLSTSLARNAIGAKTFARMARFDLIRRNGAVVAVRLALPPLPDARRLKLPAGSRAVYDNLTAPARPQAPPPGARPLSADIPLPCPRGCPHPLTVHSADLGCWCCDCTHGRT